MSEGNWDYFSTDKHFSDVLKARLAEGIEMDSAKAIVGHMNSYFKGELRVLDFGSGPGHYYPVLKKLYVHGTLSYLGVDIDKSHVMYGEEYFKDDPQCRLCVGSVLDPQLIDADINCIMSANTLPHVPTIEPLLRYISSTPSVRFFIFRMLIGSECVQIKKHLLEHDFVAMFDQNFQFNNIYTLPYLEHHLGDNWIIDSEADMFDVARLQQHQLPVRDVDPYYLNRVSRSVGTLVFKGDIYMPWKYVIGRRIT